MDGHHLLSDLDYSTYTILPLYFDQWLRMHLNYSSYRMTHVNFGTSTFGTSRLRSFAGGETSKVKLSELCNLLTSLDDVAQAK
jgi:hypothetical protein